MRPLTEEETRVFFEKLAKYIGRNIKYLIDRKDENYVFRLHKDRVYYRIADEEGHQRGANGAHVAGHLLRQVHQVAQVQAARHLPRPHCAVRQVQGVGEARGGDVLLVRSQHHQGRSRSNHRGHATVPGSGGLQHGRRSSRLWRDGQVHTGVQEARHWNDRVLPPGRRGRVPQRGGPPHLIALSNAFASSPLCLSYTHLPLSTFCMRWVLVLNNKPSMHAFLSSSLLMVDT